MRNAFTWTVALLASASTSLAHGEPDLKHEHAGDVFSNVHGGGSCLSGVLHGNASRGVTKTIGGGKRHSYLDVAVCKLTSI